MPCALLAGLVPHTGLTIAYLGFVLIGAQPALQLLGAALLRGRQMPFALLGAQCVQFLLQGVIARSGQFVGFSHCESPPRSHLSLERSRGTPSQPGPA